MPFNLASNHVGYLALATPATSDLAGSGQVWPHKKRG
jgi:hypothetical protein